MSQSNIPKRLKLKDNHPTAIKLQKLFDLSEELGISLIFEGDTIVVEDRDRDPKLPTLFMEDIESDSGTGSFPPVCEYKLVYDNPAYLAEEKRKWNAADAVRQAEEEAYQKRVKLEKEEQEKRRQQVLEDKERAEFLRLKDKFER